MNASIKICSTSSIDTFYLQQVIEELLSLHNVASFLPSHDYISCTQVQDAAD